MKPRVRLETDVHLQGKDVCRVVGLHLLHQPALLSQGCVVDGHQSVGGEVGRVEAPGEAVSARGRGVGGGEAGGRREEATVPGLAQLPGHDHASFRVTIEPPALCDGRAGVPEGRRAGVVGSHWGVRSRPLSRGRRGWRSARIMAGRPVKPEHGAEQPADTQEQQQTGEQQEAFVGRPGRPAQQQQQLGFVLLPRSLKTQGNVRVPVNTTTFHHSLVNSFFKTHVFFFDSAQLLYRSYSFKVS